MNHGWMAGRGDQMIPNENVEYYMDGNPRLASIDRHDTFLPTMQA